MTRLEKKSAFSVGRYEIRVYVGPCSLGDAEALADTIQALPKTEGNFVYVFLRESPSRSPSDAVR